jgi:hypothetical protein
MFRKRLPIFVVLALTLVISFISAYYATLGFTNKAKDEDKSLKAAAETTLLPSQVLINSSTEIIIKERYLEGMQYDTKSKTEKPVPEVLGMNKESAEKYFGEKGYKLIDFSSQRVLLLREIQGWPPKRYVVKGNGEFVSIYEIGEDGSLKLQQDTGIMLNDLPEQDKQEVIKGKIYETMDEVDMLIEEYGS